MWGLRDILWAGILVGMLPFCFIQPWIGVLAWSWLAYMNPHRFSYGSAQYQMPSSMLVAVATLAGFVLTRDRKPFLWTRETILLCVMWAWFTVTTFFAQFPAEAWTEWNRVSKILLMGLLTIPLFQDRRKLRWLLLVIAFSLGFYGLKGAVFVVLTGGRYMVEGSPGRSFISANNSLALALNMCLPICLYLAKEEPRRWLRYLLYATFFASMLSVPFTYSRGGVIGLGTVLIVLYWQSRARAKILLLPAVLILAFVFSIFVPEKWVARMETMKTYDQDASANARLVSWGVAMKIAADHPIFGGGFTVFNPTTFEHYVPGYHNYHDAHSIYFNLLGEHGYPGLVLFIIIVVFMLLSLRRARRETRGSPDLQWLGNYAMMLEASIVAYLVTGAFLSVAYFDLSYELFFIAVIVRHLAHQEATARAAKAQPADADTARAARSRPRAPVAQPASA
jgi:probable O-glycosylation ligase (exosortase A-associated)